MKKPLLYFLVLILFFAGLEIFVRSNENIFSNLTDRTRIKGAMFNHRDATNVLMIGSSRFRDGVSPNIIINKFNAKNGTQINGFNAAISGTNLSRFEYMFNETINKEGINALIVEVSNPLLVEGPLGFGETTCDSTIEGNLQCTATKNVKLADWRKSFQLQNIVYAGIILMADKFEGSEIFRKNLVRDYFSSDSVNLDAATCAQWNRSVISPQASKILNKPTSSFAQFYKTLQDSANSKNIDVVFVVPPLAKKRRDRECGNYDLNRYQQVANATNNKIYNYACLELDDEIFANESHLNKKGRLLFSNFLGDDFIESYHISK